MTKVNINVEPEHEDLPSFYWLPKLHKNPYGKRFIAASNRYTTKSLSKLLTTCLAKITCHFREYCNGIYNRTGQGRIQGGGMGGSCPPSASGV